MAPSLLAPSAPAGPSALPGLRPRGAESASCPLPRRLRLSPSPSAPPSAPSAALTLISAPRRYDGRCRITLNRPEKRNALSARLQSELNEALKDADMDKTIHCVILRGAGKDFCAGYELNADPVDSVDKMKADYWRLWGEYDLDANPKKRRDVLRGGSSFDDDTWNLQQQQCTPTLVPAAFVVCCRLSSFVRWLQTTACSSSTCTSPSSPVSMATVSLAATTSRACATSSCARRTPPSHSPRRATSVACRIRCGSTTSGRSGRSASPSPETRWTARRRRRSGWRSSVCRLRTSRRRWRASPTVCASSTPSAFLTFALGW